jgi:NADPH:quinone reductase
VVADATDLAEKAKVLEATVVLDALGGPYTAQAVEALQVGGRLVVYGTSNDEQIAMNLRTFYRKGLTMYGYTGLVESAGLQRGVLRNLLGLMAEGSLRVPIGEVLPLEGAAEAHARILERRVQGKLILQCD